MSLNSKGMAVTFLANTYLQSPEFMALQPSAKGWWLQLQALCTSQENGGRLVGAGKWNNGAWRQAMGNGGGTAALKTLVSLGLVEVAGENVIVRGYHLESEARYQAARLNASKGGKVTQARRANAASPNAASSPRPESAESLDEASSVAQGSLKHRSSDKGEAGEAKRGNGSESYEREGNGSECTDTGGTPPPDDPSAPAWIAEPVEDCEVVNYESGDEEHLAPVASTGSRLDRGLR
jgi:hypothetical protein